MVLVTPNDLTLRPPRITASRFREVLSAHRSPATAESSNIWNLLTAGEVDPSFALGQFLVESIYGTSGFAVTTKSWGNMLWDPTWTGDRPKYTRTVSSGASYTYAKYDNWAQGVEDYVEYVRRYAVTPDNRYGGITNTIDKATARWVGDPLLSEDHQRYVSVLISAINNEYEFIPNTFVEVGDKMIFAGPAAVQTATKYPVLNGTALYRGTNGDLLKYASFTTAVANCRFLGPVGQPWTDVKWNWGAVIVGTSAADKVGTIVYIKNPDPQKVIK